MKTSAPHWYALRVKPRGERAAADLLRRAGVEGFVPVMRQRRRWSDRWVRVETPLFPGYVLCRLSLDHPRKVVKTPGVLGFVGFRGGPAEIPDAEIEAVRRLLDSGMRVRTAALLREGQAVSIVAGPLAGLEGRLVRIRDEQRFVVNVELLQRSVSVTVSGEDLLPHA